MDMEMKTHSFTSIWQDFIKDGEDEREGKTDGSSLSHLHSYKELMKSMNFFVVDRNGSLVFANVLFTDILGLSPENIIGRNITEIGIDVDSFLNEESELCFRTEKEEYIWLKGSQVKSSVEGNSYRLFFGEDVTAYKLREAQLETYDTKELQTMAPLTHLIFRVEKSKEGYFYYSLIEGKVAKEIGLTTETVKGKSIEDIYGLQESLFYKNKYNEVFSGAVVSYKHRFQGRTFFTTLSPVEDCGITREIIGNSVDITCYEVAEETIHHLASHDLLTGLPNRATLQSDLDEELKLWPEVTLLFCNLDRFKYVNDAFGHFAGDRVIQVMADRLESLTNKIGKLYRVGGDEFILVLYGVVPREDIFSLCERLLQRVSDPVHLSGKQFFISMSMGGARYPDDAEEHHSLVMCADDALQYSKMNGRQQFAFYKSGMNFEYKQQVSLEGDLREAISKKQLSLHYQPKVDVKTGYISGMEALVRWVHPEKGMISPGQFIPLAEKVGIITYLDEWVLREACRQNQYWIEKGYAPERIAVNVSATEIQRENFAWKVQSILEETGLSARYLEIEVTEDSVMRNTEQCIRTMQDLKTLGVSLSIDDFGTGYSSLSYLRKFPIHYLKVDRAFIKNVLRDPSDAEIVKAMIQLADAFKLEVVAEGVEDEEILAFLKENACAYYQGYYFSKPLTADDMEKLLVKRHKYR